MDEKVKSRIEKLKALAERGVGGEKETAQQKLDKLLRENGIDSVEELECDRQEFCIFRYHNEQEMVILRQCIYKVFGNTDYHIYGVRGKRNVIGVDCTITQKIEIELEFEFYKRVWYDELEIFLHAFIQKQHIFPLSSSMDKSYKLTDKDLKVLAMAEMIEEKTRYAMLESE